MQGAKLELRLPDGRRLQTILVTYGVSAWRGEDGAIRTREDPRDPEIKLTIAADVSLEKVQAKTAVWLLTEDA